jgi:hypothetical protein
MFTWKELCLQLNIAWIPARTNGRQVHFHLTDEVIQRLVGKKRVKACQALSKLYYAGYEGQVLSITDVVDFTGVSRETVEQMNISGYLPTYNLKEVGKQAEKIKRGRKKKYVRVPKLTELEEILGCDRNKRHYTLEVSSDIKELKAEVYTLPIKRSPNKTAQLSMKYLAKAAGVKSPKTARKYVKMVTEVTRCEQSHPLTLSEISDMAESQKDYIKSRKRGSGWTFLEVRGVKYAYNKPQALLAVRMAGSIEGVTVHTVKANIYKYVGIPELPSWVAVLQSALIVSGARPEALRNDLEPQKGWCDLMADLDKQIESQQEEERLWEQRQMEQERNASQLEFSAIVNRIPLGNLSVQIAGD